jgi:hypothetical protein
LTLTTFISNPKGAASAEPDSGDWSHLPAPHTRDKSARGEAEDGAGQKIMARFGADSRG